MVSPPVVFLQVFAYPQGGKSLFHSPGTGAATVKNIPDSGRVLESYVFHLWDQVRVDASVEMTDKPTQTGSTSTQVNRFMPRTFTFSIKASDDITVPRADTSSTHQDDDGFGMREQVRTLESLRGALVHVTASRWDSEDRGTVAGIIQQVTVTDDGRWDNQVSVNVVVKELSDSATGGAGVDLGTVIDIPFTATDPGMTEHPSPDWTKVRWNKVANMSGGGSCIHIKPGPFHRSIKNIEKGWSNGPMGDSFIPNFFPEVSAAVGFLKSQRQAAREQAAQNANKPQKSWQGPFHYGYTQDQIRTALRKKVGYAGMTDVVAADDLPASSQAIMYAQVLTGEVKPIRVLDKTYYWYADVAKHGFAEKTYGACD